MFIISPPAQLTMHVWRKSSEMCKRSSQLFLSSLITVWFPRVFGHCSMPVFNIVSIVSAKYFLTLCESSFVILPRRISIGCGSHLTESWSFGRSCLQFSASSSNRCTAEFSPVAIEMVSCVSETNLSTNWWVADRRKPCWSLLKEFFWNFFAVNTQFDSYLNPWPAWRFIPEPFRCKYSCSFLMIVSVRSGWFLRLGLMSNNGKGMCRSE